MLHEIQQRYTPAIPTEALRRFGFAPTPLLELEGSAFVYEGLLAGLPVALPAPSRSGHWVELLHRLSAGYQPHPQRRRLPWHANDLLDFPALIPSGQKLVYRRRDELLDRLRLLPQDAESYGLVHGDFHHGNFLIDGERITLFDFDAAEYFWYAGEVCVALYNCLPLPRGETARRRSYALDYLQHFLRGYRQEREFSAYWLAQIPLFLKYCELLNYAYFHKYWDLQDLSPRRAQVLADLRRRIEEQIPVVVLETGDLLPPESSHNPDPAV